MRLSQLVNVNQAIKYSPTKENLSQDRNGLKTTSLIIIIIIIINEYG